MSLAPPLEPPYFAVVFSSTLRKPSKEYDETSDQMVALAREQPGFLGHESARDASGVGITCSYWKDLESIRAWREHLEHALARYRGREEWYESYRLRVARVERDVPFDAG